MGGRYSKPSAVTPESIPTTVTVHTTVHTTVYTSTADLTASEVQCWIDNREILYVSLAFISGVLFAAVVFAVIYLWRRGSQRSCHNLQGEVPSQTATEESKNDQSEVAYTTVVFQKTRAPVAV